jgi:pSer/pThr/pTyr-binding forkhead associated (FHA) protein
MIREYIRIQALDPELRGRYWGFSRGFFLGRAEGLDVVLPDASVSRFHAEILSTSDGWVVRDLDSTNGTYVNGSRVDSAQLKDGDELGIGRVMLKVCRVES